MCHPMKGAGIGRKEPNGRAEHIQATRHQAQFQRDRQALRLRPPHDRELLGGGRRHRRRQMPPHERLRPPQGGHRGEGRPPRRDEEGGARVFAAPVRGRRAAGLQRLHPLLPHPGHRLQRPRRPGAPPPLRDAAGATAAVRLERVPQHEEPPRRAVRVQRVHGDAGLLQAPQVRVLAHEDDRRPAGLLHGGHKVPRRGARGVADRQHVVGGDVLRRAQGEVGAGAQVRPRGRLRPAAVPPGHAGDQGQGRERQPVPLAPGRLRRGLRGRGGAHRRHRAHRGALQRGAQRLDGRAARGAVHEGEGEPASGGQHAASGGHGGGRAGADGAGDHARQGGGPRVVGAPQVHRAQGQGDRDAGRADTDHHGRRAGRCPRLVAGHAQGQLYRGALCRRHKRQGAVRRRGHKGRRPREPRAPRPDGRSCG